MNEHEVIDISTAEGQYNDEWLLFEVVEADDRNQPLRGRLICHDRDREVVHQKDLETRFPFAYITYAGPVLPEGVEAAL